MNGLTVHVISADRSLLKTRKKSGPKMDPSGTAALLLTTLISDHSMKSAFQETLN